MVQQSTTGSIGRLCYYNRNTRLLVSTAGYYRSTREAAGTKGTIGKWEGCTSIAEYYRSTGETVMVHQITTGAIGKLCWYSRILQENSGSCICTEEYYRSTREAMLVQQSNIGAFGWLCWCNRVLQEHWGRMCWYNIVL